MPIRFDERPLGKWLPGTLEGVSVPGEQFFRVPGTLGPFSVPGSRF